MEMLIVVAIIAVLIAIAIPVFNSQLEKARDATDDANKRSALAVASAAYLSEETNLVGKYFDVNQGILTSTIPKPYGKSTVNPNRRNMVIQVKTATGDLVEVDWISAVPSGIAAEFPKLFDNTGFVSWLTKNVGKKDLFIDSEATNGNYTPIVNEALQKSGIDTSVSSYSVSIPKDATLDDLKAGKGYVIYYGPKITGQNKAGDEMEITAYDTSTGTYSTVNVVLTSVTSSGKTYLTYRLKA